MTLLTLRLHSLEAAIDAVVKSDVGIVERVFHLAEPQELSFELTRIGDSVTITLIREAEGAGKFKGVPQNDQSNFPPVKASPLAGVSIVSANGYEMYQGPAGHKAPK